MRRPRAVPGGEESPGEEAEEGTEEEGTEAPSGGGPGHGPAPASQTLGGPAGPGLPLWVSGCGGGAVLAAPSVPGAGEEHRPWDEAETQLSWDGLVSWRHLRVSGGLRPTESGTHQWGLQEGRTGRREDIELRGRPCEGGRKGVTGRGWAPAWVPPGTGAPLQMRS